MNDELKKSMEKKTKIAEKLYFAGFYALLIGFAIIFMGLFGAQSLDRWLDEDHMADPSMPYNESGNATYIITQDDILELIVFSRDTMAFGVVFVGIGMVIVGSLMAVVPSKKERHKLVCPNIEAMFWGSNVKPMYCPTCGLKLSQLEKK